MTRLAKRTEFEELLMRLQRALRGAADDDAASALMALLFHRLTRLDDGAKRKALAGMEVMIGAATRSGQSITLTEGQHARARRALGQGNNGQA